MPELPEVETVRRQLEPAVVGATITSLTVSDARWCTPLAPQELADIVVGRRVEALRRRGKYLDWVLEGEVHLLMHLRMTGTLLLEPSEELAHTRVELVLDGRRRLRFVDPRRFGTGQLVVGDAELEAFYSSRLGIEPFDEAFTPALLRGLARGRRGPIKSVPARPAPDCRDRQHLRRRGAVSHRRPPAAPGGSPQTRRVHAAARRDP